MKLACALGCHPNTVSLHRCASRHMKFRLHTWNTWQSTGEIDSSDFSTQWLSTTVFHNLWITGGLQLRTSPDYSQWVELSTTLIEFSLSTRNRGTQTQLKDGDIVLKLNSKNLIRPFFWGEENCSCLFDVMCKKGYQENRPYHRQSRLLDWCRPRSSEGSTPVSLGRCGQGQYMFSLHHIFSQQLPWGFLFYRRSEKRAREDRSVYLENSGTLKEVTSTTKRLIHSLNVLSNDDKIFFSWSIPFLSCINCTKFGEVWGGVSCVWEKPVCHFLIFRVTVSDLLRLVTRYVFIWVCKWGPQKFLGISSMLRVSEV